MYDTQPVTPSPPVVLYALIGDFWQKSGFFRMPFPVGYHLAPNTAIERVTLLFILFPFTAHVTHSELQTTGNLVKQHEPHS